MKRLLLALAIVAAGLPSLLAGAGCGRNGAETFLAPTGIRPRPTHWNGAVTGLLLYDPINTPDLIDPPYPPTRVELWRDTSLAAVDSLPVSTRWFTFDSLAPGTYTVIARSSMFFAAAVTGVRVSDSQADAGNLVLNVNPSATGSGLEIMGSMPGFRLSDLDYAMWFPLDSTRAGATSLGVWVYPLPLPASPSDEDLAYDHYAQTHPVTAGTHRFKFATLYPASETNLTGWGNLLGGTLTAPVANHPSAIASGPATDIVMTFPTTGVYRFTLDERRQTFSVQLDHATPAPSTRLARR